MEQLLDSAAWDESLRIETELLEMRIVPLLCALLKPDLLEDDGFGAAAKVRQSRIYPLPSSDWSAL